MVWGLGRAGGKRWNFGRACGEAGGPERSGAPALIEVLFRNGLGLSGIEPGALIEVVGEGFLGDLLSFPTRVPDMELGLGRSSGGMDEGGRSGLADVGQDQGDGFRLGEDRDERERRLTGWADEGKDLIDPSQQGRPPGGSGRGDIGCFRCWQLGLGGGRRDLWFGRRETVEAGDLSGQRVVLLGPGRDQRPQGRVGGEDPVVTVAVDAGMWEDFGEPV